MVNILTQHVLEVVEDRTEVFIDLTAEATDEQAEVLVSELNKLPAIKESIFVTPEQTLVDFTSRHSHDPLMIESLDALEENPFQGSIKLTVHDIGDFPAILSELSKEEYTPFLEIEDNEFTEAKLLIERISDYSVKVQKTFFFISLLFIIISVLVVFNTIQIGIYTHREEIGIMKLVGASNSFIRSPFLIEGFFYSFIGFILLLILLYPFLSFIQSYIDGFFGEYSLNLISALNSNFIKVFASEFFVAIIITMASSLLAVRRYLKV